MIDLKKVKQNWDFQLQKKLEEDRKHYYEFLWQFYPIFDKAQRMCVNQIHLEQSAKETVYEGEAFNLFSDPKYRRVTNLKVIDMWQSNLDPSVIIVVCKEEEE